MLMGVGIACIMLMPGMEGQLKKVILSYLMFRVAFWSFVF